MARFAQRHRVEILLLAGLLAIFICSLAMAKQVYAPPQDQGTAADFTRAYPFIVIAFVVLLLTIIGYFIHRRDEDKKARDAGLREQLKSVSDGFVEANKALKEATGKIDATIATLFDRDREIERRQSSAEERLSRLEGTCEQRGKLCPGVAGIA